MILAAILRAIDRWADRGIARHVGAEWSSESYTLDERIAPYTDRRTP